MLEAANITYRVGNKQLLSDISVSFAPGKLNLIIGPNGAGKSTLIKVLAGLVRPQTGTTRYDGLDIDESSRLELAKRRSVLSQAVEIAFPLTVREVVMMGRYPHFGGRPGSTDEQIVDQVMTHFDVTEFRDRNYQTLSGGERQRVNFARVLAQLWSDAPPESGAELAAGSQASRYLFLDEPLTFLDIRYQIDFMKKVRVFAGRPGVITVGVVHDLNLAARFADHVVLMDHGQIVASGTPHDVLTAERIREVFSVQPTFMSADKTGFHLIFE